MASAIDGIAKIIAGMIPKQSSAAEMTGRVTRIDDEGTAWVRFPGATEDTPCTRRSAEVEPGQRVDVRIKNGVASITGNYSAPATDDSAAAKALDRASMAAMVGTIALGQATDASGFINTHLGVDEDGFWIGNLNSKYRILSAPGGTDDYSTPGVYVVDEDGNVVSRFGAEVDMSSGTIAVHMDPDKFTVGLVDHVTDGSGTEDFVYERLSILRADDYRNAGDELIFTMSGPAVFSNEVTFGGRTIFSTGYDDDVLLGSDVADNGSIGFARRGPMASAHITATALKSFPNQELSVRMPYGFKPVHDTITESGVKIIGTQLIIPASLRNGKSINKTVTWCCENYTGVFDE